MLNPLKFIRCLVFAVFVICNAIIASAGVWNLSIVQGIVGDVVANEISAYLIFVGVSGLVVIFIVIFFDIYGKDVFIGRVWFEFLWVILFLIMELAGGVAITAQSNGLICGSNTLVSPCASTQVLQAFTWICAALLLSYSALLLVLAILKHKDDNTIWRCNVRKFLGPKSVAASSASLPTFRTQIPISIAAPRPRRIVPIPDVTLSYRSGLSLEYGIEHYEPLALGATDLGPSTDGRLSPLTISAAIPPTRTPPPQKPIPTAFTPFYPSYVQAVMDPGLQRPSTAYLGQVTRLPPSPSPPPLGDWPRRNATSLPPRTKRKPVAQNAPVTYSFTTPSNIQQRRPREMSLTRSRPSGPRQRSVIREVVDNAGDL